MSYILDALKKSEEERKRGTVPDLLAVQDTRMQEQGKPHMWPYLLLVALVLNAGIFLWWLTPWQGTKQNVTAYSTTKQNPLPEKTIISEERKQGEKHLPAQIGSPVKTPIDKKVSERQGRSVQTKTAEQAQVPSASAPAVETQESRANSPSLSLQAPAAIPTPSETKPSTSSKDTGGSTLYNLTELPSTIQQSLPTFSITAHIHTGDPASGMVKINGQMMREGQELSPGLKLEEILADGVIFRYQNYRFRVGLK
ncbi:MAG TPA: general secretion pathway protein GspB [Thermodesulfovibrionales bacterium]|nr:general secretion pathway protein GspB [Thermodesulfovibrionales bacterium]